jgi:hypothetical protein
MDQGKKAGQMEGAGIAGVRSEWESLCNRMRWGEDEQIIHLEGFLVDRGLMVAFLQYAKDAAGYEEREREAVKAAAAGGEGVTIVYDFEGEVVEVREAVTQNGLDIEAVDMEVIGCGVAKKLDVRYPRGERYGVPVEASQQGGERWTKDMGFVLGGEFEVWGEDSGDDSTIQMTLTVQAPPGWSKGH